MEVKILTAKDRHGTRVNDWWAENNGWDYHGNLPAFKHGNIWVRVYTKPIIP